MAVPQVRQRAAKKGFLCHLPAGAPLLLIAGGGDGEMATAF